MLSLVVAGFSAAPEIGVGGAIDLGRGAIAGALVVGAAFLAGFAVFRRGAAAVCGLLMVAAAAALEFTWLGLFTGPAPQVVTLLQGLFGAAALIFLSSTVRLARNNTWIGGVMFAAALSLVGAGVIGLIGRGDMSGLMRFSLGGVGLFAAAIALSQVTRDSGARMILPGLAAMIAAAIAANAGAGFSLLPHVLFTLGVLAASLVALTETPRMRMRNLGLHADEQPASAFAGDGEDSAADETPMERALRVSENQLAQVLDYAGVAVWDWSPDGAHQTDGLYALMGADARGAFTPDAMLAFLHRDDVERFEKNVLDTSLGDGAFDASVKLHDGRVVRLRGARAVDGRGGLERIVAFVEPVKNGAKNKQTGAEPSAKPRPHPLAAAVAAAIEADEIGADFQPIVSLDKERVEGHEALARWRGPDGSERAGAEEIVRAAVSAGKGRALARLMLAAAAEHLVAEREKAGRDDLFVAVNFSVAQITDPGFADDVKAVIRHLKLAPGALVIELTESEALTDEAARVLAELKKAGAGLAFDDFGAGFSSLANLNRHQFDYLKIDKSFLLEGGEGGAKIARALAALGRDMGLAVIAEGIETPALAAIARDMGCAYGQGYAYGAPSPLRSGESDAPQTEEEAPAPEAAFAEDAAHEGGGEALLDDAPSTETAAIEAGDEERELELADAAPEAERPQAELKSKPKRGLFSGGLR